MMEKDVFICHASEDKPGIARVLVQALEQEGISCWYDEHDILWGDDFVDKINMGLAKSRYVIVIISEYSISKPWPKLELSSALNIELRNKRTTVLPLLVGVTSAEAYGLLHSIPLLTGKKCLYWEGNPQSIVDSLKDVINRVGQVASATTTTSSYPSPPMPHLSRRITQIDKDSFLENGFSYIIGYFNNALQHLSSQSQMIDFRVNEHSKTDYRFMIYKNGEQNCQCRIWQGVLGSTSCIYYYSGVVYSSNDTTCNDYLTVGSDRHNLCFVRSSLGLEFNYPQNLPLEQAAEFYWVRFTSNLR